MCTYIIICMIAYDGYVFFNLSPHGELSPSPHHALEDMLPLPVRIVSLFPGWNLALRYSMKSSYKNQLSEMATSEAKTPGTMRDRCGCFQK